MFTYLVVAAVVLAKLVNALEMVHMERSSYELREDFIRRETADENKYHEVVIAIKQRNLDQLEKLFYEVSDPTNEKYGKFLTREQVADLTADPKATEEVKRFLLNNDVKIIKTEPYGEYITAVASIGTWQKLLATTFYNFDHVEDSQQNVLRAVHYSVPKDIHQYIQTIFNTVHLPPIMKKGAHITLKDSTAANSSSITPAKINSYYHVTSNVGNSKSTQSLYESLGQYFSPSDLATFQKNYNLPSDQVDFDINGYSSDSQCVSNANNCAEANLDVQYLIAVSNTSPTTYWYDPSTSNDVFVDWIKSVSATSNPPLVHSISYGAVEDAISASTVTQFNTEAQKLGLQGVTIVASSGDDGVANFQARNLKARCGYHPSFPASSPYVLAVGATQGAETGSKETACLSNTGGVITTGGGFSSHDATPAYQQSAVTAYLNSATGKKAATGYNAKGRGYPDVALAGLNYEVVIGGKTYQVSGTSASSPVVAGFVSLVNAARLAAGKTPLGFVNTAIYQHGTEITNDVTDGENNCTAGSVCCTQGFYSAAGWDPVTGFGSVDFTKFSKVFSAL